MPSEIEILILAIFSIQAIFSAYYLIGLVRIKSTDTGFEATEGVSIVIAARNELDNLKLLLPKLLSQEYPEFEIIIVNDRSSDGSFEFLSEMEAHPLLRIVTIKDLPEHVNGKKYAITLGVKAASYDIILFTDADCQPASKSWIYKMAAGYIDSTQIVLGYSPYFSGSGILNAMIQLETHLVGVQYIGSASNSNPYMGVGRNLSYRRAFFMDKKGFAGYSDVTGGDDDLFINQNGTGQNTAVVLDPDAVCWSNPAITLKQYWNQKTRHLSVGKYYKLADRVFLGFYALLRLFLWPILIFSVVLGMNQVLYISFFVVNYILLIFNIAILKKKSGSGISMWTIPFVDLIYQLFYILVGLRAVFIRKIEWTK